MLSPSCFGTVYGYQKWAEDRDPPIWGWIHYSHPRSPSRVLIYPDEVVEDEET